MEPFVSFGGPYANTLSSCHYGRPFDHVIADESGYASDDPDFASLQAPDPVNIYEDIAQITIPLRLSVVELQPSSTPSGHVPQLPDLIILSSIHSIRAGALTAFFCRLL